MRTVSNQGIIPTTSIQVIDKDGRSISCSYNVYTKNKDATHVCKIDSLINLLETCIDCKTLKSKAQMDSIRTAFIRVPAMPQDCKPGYGDAVYISVMRYEGGALQATNKKISKGCGKTGQENKLVMDFINAFEHKSSGTIEQINTAFAKGTKPISDYADKDFVPQVNKDSAAFAFTAMITKEGLLRCVSNATLIQLHVFFISSSVRMWGRKGAEEKPGSKFSLTYQLRQKSGSELYDVDIKDGRYKTMHKLIIVPMADNGKKVEFTIINKTIPEVMVLK